MEGAVTVGGTAGVGARLIIRLLKDMKGNQIFTLKCTKYSLKISSNKQSKLCDLYNHYFSSPFSRKALLLEQTRNLLSL